MLKSEKMGNCEREAGFASYKTIVDKYVGNIVLYNNIVNIDESIWDNLKNGYDEEIEEYKEVFQYYLCNLSEYEEQQLLEMGFILSYSDMLGCDVLCVDNFGTSWDYVLTNVKLFDTYEDLEKYEKGL